MHVKDLKIYFRKRGYSDNFIKKQDENSLRLSQSDENNSKKVIGICLVVAYNPAFKNLS